MPVRANPNPKRRPTQLDVAHLAGVSQTAVSLVLNHDRRAPASISAETRQRVLAAVAQLGYTPDGAARSLRTRSTSLIASLIPDITNPFYPAFERGIQDVADARGYDLLVYNTDGTREKELKGIRSVLRARVDGLIVTPFQVTMDDLRPLLDFGTPVVGHWATTPEDTPVPFDDLFVDGEAGARVVVTHLLDRGHRRIGMVAGPAAVRRGHRADAYRQVLAERGLLREELLVWGSDFTEAGGYEAMRRLLAADPPTAVFAANDLMAMGAMVAIREAGLRVPADVAVAGFDDIPVARLLNPPLTTVAQFPERLGRRAAEMLFERLDGLAPPEGRRVVMPFELMVRAST